MGSFIDVSCPKCGRKHGWFGGLKDRPPCPKCGHRVTVSTNDPDEIHFKEMENMLRQRMLCDKEPTRYTAEQYMWAYDSELKNLNKASKHVLPKALFEALEGGHLQPETKGLMALRIYETKDLAVKAFEQAYQVVYQKNLDCSKGKVLLSDLMKNSLPEGDSNVKSD